MTDKYHKALLRVAIAQIAKNIGFTSASLSSLDVLQDILADYMQVLCHGTHQFTEYCGRSYSVLEDVGLALAKMGLSTRELSEYLAQTTPAEFHLQKLVQLRNVEKQDMLNIPRQDHPELKTRPQHIPSYLPLLKPESPVKKKQQQSVAPTTNLQNSGLKTHKKSHARSDETASADWLSSLYDFDAFKAGLVKTVEIAIESTVESTDQVPATVAPSTDIQVQRRPDVFPRRAPTPVQPLPSKPTVKSAGAKKSFTTSEAFEKTYKTGPKKRAAQHRPTTPTAQLSTMVLPTATVRLSPLELSVHPALTSKLTPTLTSQPSSEKSSSVSSDTSFSIDQCITSVIEQSTAATNRRAPSPSVKAGAVVVEAESSVTGSAAVHRRSAFIEAAVRQARVAVDDVLNVADFVKDATDDGAAVLHPEHGPKTPPTSPEALKAQLEVAKKSDIVKKDVSQLASKKRKAVDAAPTPQPAKRVALPPRCMPAVDTSALFKPDVPILGPRKVSPLLVHRFKKFRPISAASSSSRTATPGAHNSIVVPVPSRAKLAPKTASSSTTLQERPSTPHNKKLGPLKIKLAVPSSSSAGKRLKKQSGGDKTEIFIVPKATKKLKRRPSTGLQPAPSTPAAPVTETLQPLEPPTLSSDTHSPDQTAAASAERLTLKLKVPKLILKLGPPKAKDIEEEDVAALSLEVPAHPALKIKISPKQLTSAVPKTPPTPASSASSSPTPAAQLDWTPVSDANVVRLATPTLVASPPPPTPSPRSVSGGGISPPPPHTPPLFGDVGHRLPMRTPSPARPPTPTAAAEDVIVEHVDWSSSVASPGSRPTIEPTVEPTDSIAPIQIVSPRLLSPKQASSKHHKDQKGGKNEEDVDDDDTIWYCPICQVPYEDGVDMIACDKCDNWFHWTCVGLTKAPPDHEKWFCPNCSKKTKPAKKKMKK